MTAAGAGEERTGPRYPIESVDRSLTLLQMLAGGSSVRVSEVRVRLGVGQSTAHRLLAMFVYRGFAVQDPVNRSYSAGPALVDLRQGGGDRRVADAAEHVLGEMSAACHETVHFGVLDGVDVRFVSQVVGPLALRVIGRAGQTRPAHATSLGRAILAAESDAFVRSRFAAGALPSGTYSTLATVAELLDELRETRDRGFAVNHGDVESGICSVGAAVVDDQGDVLGGLSVSAPEYRWGPDIERSHADVLIAAARRLGRMLSAGPVAP